MIIFLSFKTSLVEVPPPISAIMMHCVRTSICDSLLNNYLNDAAAKQFFSLQAAGCRLCNFFAGAPQNEDPLRRLQLHASSIRNISKKLLLEKLLGKYLGHFCKNCRKSLRNETPQELHCEVHEFLKIFQIFSEQRFLWTPLSGWKF